MHAIDVDAPAAMKITYDREVDALYIRFKKTTVTTKQVEHGIAFDYDAAQRLANPQSRQQIVFQNNPLSETKNPIAAASRNPVNPRIP